MSLTPPKKTSAMRTSYQSTVYKSANVTPARTTAFSNVKEITLDPQSKYTISYVPGVCEHEIETGKTFEEAKMKIVLLTSELERVNTYNYTLVRENEVLRVQANKSEREKDLETKLAIVLAENEKLNHVIEEIYEVYMSQRGYGSNEEYEKRIYELYEDLEDWKQKYNVLETQNVVQLQNNVKDLNNQKELLSEQLARKDRDLEALRVRLASLEGNSSASTQNVQYLTAENAALKKELEAIKLKYGKADGLELKLNGYDEKIRTILAENEKLNQLLVNKVNENQDLRAQIDYLNQQSRNQANEFAVNRQAEESHKRSAGNANLEFARRIQELTDENDELRQQLENLKAKLGNIRDIETRLNIISEENQRLTTLLNEKERENMSLSRSSSQSQENKATLDRLSAKLKDLLQENDKLHTLLAVKTNEFNAAAEENKRLREQFEQKRREVDELYARLNEVHQNSLLAGEYKDKIIIISQENERLNTLLQAKFEEIDTLKRRIVNLESSKVNTEAYEEKIRLLLSENQRITDLIRNQAAELDGLRNKLYEAQNSAALIEELYSKLALISSENERLNMELNRIISEKYKLEALVQEKDREINHLKENQLRVVESNNMELNRQNENLKSAGAEQRKKIGDLEGRLSQLLVLETKINYFNMELDKLHQDVADRENHIQMLAARLAEKEREIEDLKKKVYASENQRLLEAEELKHRIISEQERKALAMREELEGEIRRLMNEKKDLEDKVIYVSVEFERLQTIVKNSRGELDQWKNRCHDLEEARADGDREVEELRGQFEILKQLNLQVKDLQLKFNAERTAYETQIFQLNQAVSDYENQLRMLYAENERVTSLSVQRLTLIEELKEQNNEEQHKLEVYELRNQLELLKSNSYDVKQLAVQYSTERAADQARISELMQINASFKSEIEKLSDLMEKRRADVDSLTQQNEDLRRMCEKLTHQNRNSSASVRVENFEIMQNKVAELEASRNEYQRQAERNAIELTRKNRELVDKIQELDIVKMKYEEALANYQALNTQAFARLSYKNY